MIWTGFLDVLLGAGGALVGLTGGVLVVWGLCLSWPWLCVEKSNGMLVDLAVGSVLKTRGVEEAVGRLLTGGFKVTRSIFAVTGALGTSNVDLKSSSKSR